MNGRLVSSVPKKPRSRVNAARVRTPPRAALSAMVHLEETEPAPERASEDACASGEASDAGYAQRIDKEWRDQLASARDANAGLDENDVDARELYGEQAVHNFPDVHEDWGDAKAKAARAARMRAVAEMSPDGKEGLERTGWNTAYRAGLENALDAVRDSKTMMANLRSIRSRQKDIDDGVEIGHLKGKTAKEANAEWEKQRLEARDAERRRRAAAATLAAKQKTGAESSSDFGERFGLPSLPDFLKRSSLDVGDDEGAEAAARALAEKHGEWIRTLDEGNPMAKEETRAIAKEAEAEAAEAKEEKKNKRECGFGAVPRRAARRGGARHCRRVVRDIGSPRRHFFLRESDVSVASAARGAREDGPRRGFLEQRDVGRRRLRRRRRGGERRGGDGAAVRLGDQWREEARSLRGVTRLGFSRYVPSAWSVLCEYRDMVYVVLLCLLFDALEVHRRLRRLRVFIARAAAWSTPRREALSPRAPVASAPSTRRTVSTGTTRGRRRGR